MVIFLAFCFNLVRLLLGEKFHVIIDDKILYTLGILIMRSSFWSGNQPGRGDADLERFNNLNNLQP